MTKTDDLFSKPLLNSPFVFDQNVAEVFPDMISRSVPGYQQIIANIKKFAARYVTHESNCYDLGCSLGAASLAISAGIKDRVQAKIIGVDNSQAMIDRCQQHINAFRHHTPIELVCANLQDLPLSNASMVVLNFTLQFIAREQRKQILDKVYQGLNPGGLLILSEKIELADPMANELIIDLHHEFKKDNGYSELEVSQKRNALENVLLPETTDQHLKRLHEIGFSHAACWLQQYNFVSIFAIK